MGVTENHGAIALHEVDVLVAFDVPQPCALGAGYHIWPTAD